MSTNSVDTTIAAPHNELKPDRPQRYAPSSKVLYNFASSACDSDYISDTEQGGDIIFNNKNKKRKLETSVLPTTTTSTNISKHIKATAAKALVVTTAENDVAETARTKRINKTFQSSTVLSSMVLKPTILPSITSFFSKKNQAITLPLYLTSSSCSSTVDPPRPPPFVQFQLPTLPMQPHSLFEDDNLISSPVARYYYVFLSSHIRFCLEQVVINFLNRY